MAFNQSFCVRFRDLDALGHVNHAVYLTYAETARCDWFQSLGYTAMAELPFIVAAAHVEYQDALRKDDIVTVAMKTLKIGTKSWKFSYEIHSARGLAATVETVQVAYDYKNHQTVPLSGDLKVALESLL